MHAVGRVFVTLVVALIGVCAFLGYRGELVLPWQPRAEEYLAVAEPPPPVPLDPVLVAAQVEPALVNISVDATLFGADAAGSGIVLTADGQILTSHHVIKGADEVSVTDIGNGAVYPATVLGYDSTADIALLSLAGATGLPTARLGTSSELRIRQDVLAIGDAGGDGGAPTAVAGPITDLDASIVAMNSADMSRKSLRGMVQIAAPVVGGQSGGALVDGGGAVVGVITAASGERTQARQRETPATGYAVPIDTAMRIVTQIRSGVPTETVHIGPTATLGVHIVDARPSGAEVSWALYGQPARAAGITTGDVITAVDGVAITTAKALSAAINVRRPADRIRLDITAPDGTTRVVEVVLARGTPN
ncbi:S1C family serine protease [Nocardia neocaledoniensis]|uniref:S1C family serine protease n=1 Tax=Nocardia neocaledoniensis TaxID=236511 RepID=UPI002454E644|nr:trypsin-like peptidase domain-containing protein [Nocardia neocaledoniensis]